MGQSTLTLDNFQRNVNLSHLAKGLYFMELVSGNKRVIKKLIKQ